MSWSIGYDTRWRRDIGYGVPAYCDHPDCSEEIDRGLSFVCGDAPRGGDHGCGLYFCEEHRGNYIRRGGNSIPVCIRCFKNLDPFPPKPEHPDWLTHILTDASWRPWRKMNPKLVHRYQKVVFPKLYWGFEFVKWALIPAAVAFVILQFIW